MSTISEIWNNSRNTFETKSLAQILSFAGDGKLKDSNSTSKEFRSLLEQITSSHLKGFANSCLVDKFEDSGFALQDIINQVGKRLGFSAKNGLYRGVKNNIGFDGLWQAKDGHFLIVEIKTTDAYRINLDVIAGYRDALIREKEIEKEKSSILIVVGRQDTGDLEAQIRGSKHAWDIRLISADALINLLILKEELNDTRTIERINQLLKPREYTRVDQLIDLIFETSKDLLLDDNSLSDEATIQDGKEGEKDKTTPVHFHAECLKKIETFFGFPLIKQSRISFSNKEKTLGLVCAISKPHKQGANEKYWFAFHPHQHSFLSEYNDAYVAFGCGDASQTFLIPLETFLPLVNNMWTTQNDTRMYWHVVIHRRQGKFLLAQPEKGANVTVDITRYKL